MASVRMVYQAQCLEKCQTCLLYNLAAANTCGDPKLLMMLLPQFPKSLALPDRDDANANGKDTKSNLAST